MSIVALPTLQVINGMVHVQLWRSERFIIIQNYDNDSIRGAGANCRIKLFEVIKENGGEELGNLLLTTTSLTHAIDEADRIAREAT